MKPNTVKVRGELTLREGVTLTEVAQAVGEANLALAKIGTGGIRVAVPRGEYAV